MADLKPCHCGGKPLVRTALMGVPPIVGPVPQAYVECPDCFARGGLHDKQADAVDDWNRRAAPADKQGENVNTRQLFEQTFNAEAIQRGPLTPDMQHYLFAVGVQKGMVEAAKVLDGQWFKTQKDCAEAIRAEAMKL